MGFKGRYKLKMRRCFCLKGFKVLMFTALIDKVKPDPCVSNELVRSGGSFQAELLVCSEEEIQCHRRNYRTQLNNKDGTKSKEMDHPSANLSLL